MWVRTRVLGLRIVPTAPTGAAALTTDSQRESTKVSTTRPTDGVERAIRVAVMHDGQIRRAAQAGVYECAEWNREVEGGRGEPNWMALNLCATYRDQ
ncbi:hypothetical protein BKA62DRAFT_415947 [Auriculariales sp. MPI-PUGE-AT-0066]|nr:hypothetical protein BKA62DRAFT_415947 [Auriculariales sp. MPI-PUGE-AT-0066]